jgi:hypothetical protein
MIAKNRVSVKLPLMVFKKKRPMGGLTDGGRFGKLFAPIFDKTRKEHHGERDTTVD